MSGTRIAALLPLALAGCAAAAPADGRLVVVMQVIGQVEQAELRLAHPGDERHLCIQPQRVRLPPAEGPAPPTHVFGYEVSFGPDFLPTDGTPTPAWRGYGPQERFGLHVPALPDQLEGTGPVRLGRDFVITVGAGGALWSRRVEAGEADASLTIAPDGHSGRFRVARLVRQVPHGRMPDSDAIAVAGTWRCP